MLEAGRVCSGNTGRTTAKITAQHGLVYAKLIREYGAIAARRFYEANMAAIEAYRTLAEKIPCDCEEKTAYVYSTADRDALEKILYNLVSNAYKYTPAGGTVTLSAQMLDGFCRVDVTDSGPGIPEEEQGAIFDRFYRGARTRSAEGLGLGLYLARQILALQGGYIKVSSAPGKGSTFSLYLPREPERI